MKINKPSIALIVLIVGSGFVVDPATAETASRYAPAEPARNEIIIEHDLKAVWPLYSGLCEYKTVMNNEDMHRCGVFLNIGPFPSAEVTRIDLRKIRSYR